LNNVFYLKKKWGPNSLAFKYTLDELTESIGFSRGSLALHIAGYKTLSMLIRASEEELLAIPGIGRRKVQLIAAFFATRGHSYPFRPSPKWPRLNSADSNSRP